MGKYVNWRVLRSVWFYLNIIEKCTYRPRIIDVHPGFIARISICIHIISASTLSYLLYALIVKLFIIGLRMNE